MADAPGDAVFVHSVQEEYFYMMIRRCACGGPWLGDSQEFQQEGQRLRHHVGAQCYKCKARRTFEFVLPGPEDSKAPIRQINPTAQPSRALDVAEWMDLAQFYLSRIERLKKPGERAQSLLDARQCIEEALKFYGASDDGPSADALWSDASRKKVARHPDAFRRSALAAMLEKMPDMKRLRVADKMEQQKFEKTVKELIRKHDTRRWWQVWKFFKRRQ